MCKEDVRLARAAVPGLSARVDTSGGATKVFAANAERYSISCGLTPNGQSVPNSSALVYVIVNGVKVPIAGVSFDHPCDRVTLMDVGQLLLYDIWVDANDSNTTPDISIAETRWDVPQDRI